MGKSEPIGTYGIFMLGHGSRYQTTCGDIQKMKGKQTRGLLIEL